MAKKEKEVKAKKKSKVAEKETKKAKTGTKASAKEAPKAKKGFPAKKAGTAAKKPASKKKKLPTFAAPSDFKPHFLEVLVRTEKDGLLAGAIKATRYQGRYDTNAEDKKKADLGTYDPATLRGILARLSAKTFATNPLKRLPAKSVFRLLLRVNKKSADGSISVSIKTVWLQGENAKGRVKFNELDKKDPVCRKIRGAARLLPAAFANVQMPPKKVRGKAKDKDDSDDE